MEFLYFGKQLLLTLGTAVAAFIIAKGLFRGSLKLTALEEVALLTPVGLGVLILLLFTLGILGLLSPTSALACVALLLLSAAWRLKPRPWLAGRRALRLRVNPRKLMLLAAAAALLAPIALAPLAPPHSSDEVRYHLPYALHFVEQAAIIPDLHLRYPFFTLNINLLYSFALMIGDDVTTHYMHFMLGLLAALNLYALALRLTDAVTAFCSALLFLSLPTVLQLAASAYVDLGLACFAFAAVVCLSRCTSSTGPPLVLCAGLLFGIALGSKYLALAYIPLLLAWAHWHSRSWRPALLFLAVAVLVGMPWYAYNAVHTGNPFSPFAGEIFGYWPWSAEDMADQFHNFENHHGFGKSPLNLLMLPHNLMVNHWHFSSPPIPIAAMAVFPSFLLIPWMLPKVRPFAVLLLAALLTWFFSVQGFRYLAAFLPLWCFFSLWFVRWLATLVVRSLPQGGRSGALSKRLRLLPSGLVVLAVLPNYFGNEWLVLPGEAGELVAGREAYLERKVPEYGLVKHLRRSGTEGERIYQLGAGALLTYARSNRVLGDYWGILGLRHLWDKYGRNAQGVIDELAANGVSLLATKSDVLRKYPGWDGWMRNNLAIEYEDGSTVLFAFPKQDPTRELHCPEPRIP